MKETNTRKKNRNYRYVIYKEQPMKTKRFKYVLVLCVYSVTMVGLAILAVVNILSLCK